MHAISRGAEGVVRVPSHASALYLFSEYVPGMEVLFTGGIGFQAVLAQVKVCCDILFDLFLVMSPRLQQIMKRGSNLSRSLNFEP